MLLWLTKIWLKYLAPCWNVIPAWGESWFYDKCKGSDIFILLRNLTPDVDRIAESMRTRDFKWTSDPLGGYLDFHSLAWVTCAKGAGDCDDWARLWYELLKSHGQAEKLYTKRKWGGAHAMIIFTRDGTSYLLSNIHVYTRVPEHERDKLLFTFYGDETDFSVIY